MAEKKIKTISEILSEGGVQYNTPVNEILEKVNENTVPSVEEKIKDASTEEYSVEEKKDYSKSKVLSNDEVNYINNIKSDKQRNDIMRLKDIFRDNPQIVSEYLDAIKQYGSEEKAKEAGSKAALIQGYSYLFNLAKNNPSLREDVTRYGKLKLFNQGFLMGGDDRYDRELRVDTYGKLRKKAYESELLVKTRKGAEIAVKKGARGTTIFVVALFDALPK